MNKIIKHVLQDMLASFVVSILTCLTFILGSLIFSLFSYDSLSVFNGIMLGIIIFHIPIIIFSILVIFVVDFSKSKSLLTLIIQKYAFLFLLFQLIVSQIIIFIFFVNPLINIITLFIFLILNVIIVRNIPTKQINWFRHFSTLLYSILFTEIIIFIIKKIFYPKNKIYFLSDNIGVNIDMLLLFDIIFIIFITFFYYGILFITNEIARLMLFIKKEITILENIDKIESKAKNKVDKNK